MCSIGTQEIQFALLFFGKKQGWNGWFVYFYVRKFLKEI